MSDQLKLPGLSVTLTVPPSERVLCRLIAAVPAGTSNAVLLQALARLVSGALILEADVDAARVDFTGQVQSLLTRHAEWEAEQQVLADVRELYEPG